MISHIMLLCKGIYFEMLDFVLCVDEHIFSVIINLANYWILYYSNETKENNCTASVILCSEFFLLNVIAYKEHKNHNEYGRV